MTQTALDVGAQVQYRGEVGRSRYWKRVHHLDERARALADRHYSRQHVGAREFCPPGNKIVLLGLNDDACGSVIDPTHRPEKPLPIGWMGLTIGTILIFAMSRRALPAP